MDVGSWCNSGDGHAVRSRKFSETAEIEYHRFVPFKLPVTGARVTIWRLLWRKIKKEKKKIFEYSTSVQFSYDPYEYSQNFDEGSIWDDPDDDGLSRSFSARFAVPSRIFQNQKSTDGLMASYKKEVP